MENAIETEEATIGSEDVKASYVKSLVDNWIDQLNLLSKIAEPEPQSAYSAFAGAFKGKLTYYMRTIPCIKDYLIPLEEVNRFKFIPSITRGHICSNDECLPPSLLARFGGLGIPLFHENAGIEFENSRKLTSSLTDLIKDQSALYSVYGIEHKKIKTTIKTERENTHKNVLNTLQNRLNENQLRLNSINRRKGVSSWLILYPISDHGFDRTKQQFWDSLRLRYGWALPNIPSTCCAKMDAQHAMSCKRGGSITIRHNDLQDLTVNFLSNVCNDVEIEPKLPPVTGENFSNRAENTRTEARLDIRSRGFWVRGQQAFFDIRVFDQNAKRYLNSALPQCYAQNEKEKKKQYNERVLEIEHGSFTPLVFSIYGGMSREYSTFYDRLSNLLSEKRDIPPSVTINWIRTKILFALLKSCLLCLRGTQSHNRNIATVEDEVQFSCEVSKIL